MRRCWRGRGRACGWRCEDYAERVAALRVETAALGWVILGHSAGALAGVDAAASDVSAKDDVSVVNLAAPVAWNPVSLTFSMWMYERRARAMGVAEARDVRSKPSERRGRRSRSTGELERDG